MDKELTVREAGERRVVADIIGMMAAPSLLVDGFGHDAAFVDLRYGDDELLVLNTDRSGLNAAYGLGLAGPECVGDFGVCHAISDIVVAGGIPRAVTVALLLPVDSTLGFVRGVMQRNVSTTLIQPGSEFKLGYEASIELRGAGRVRQRLVLVWAIRGSDCRRAWVRVA